MFYPFDRQNVTFTFNSASFGKSVMPIYLSEDPFLINDPGSINEVNIDWDIERGDLYMSESYGSYGLQQTIQYSIIIKRNANVMIVALIMPGILITFFGVCYWFIPIGTGERSNFLATIILTLVMFLVMITGYVPLSKEVPILGWLFLSYVMLVVMMAGMAICLEHKMKKLREYMETDDDMEMIDDD